MRQEANTAFVDGQSRSPCNPNRIRPPSLPESEPAQGGRVDEWGTTCTQSWDLLKRESRVATCAVGFLVNVPGVAGPPMITNPWRPARSNPRRRGPTSEWATYVRNHQAPHPRIGRLRSKWIAFRWSSR